MYPRAQQKPFVPGFLAILLLAAALLAAGCDRQPAEPPAAGDAGDAAATGDAGNVGATHAPHHGDEPDPYRSIGLFKPGERASAIEDELDAEALSAAVEQRRRRGERLGDFEPYLSRKQRGIRFSVLWQPGAGPPSRWQTSPCADFAAVHESYTGDRFHLVDMERWEGPEGTFCAGLWRRGVRRQQLVLDQHCDRFEERAEALQGEGYRLDDLEVWSADGVRRCSGLFRQSDEAGGQVLMVGLEVGKLEVKVQEQLAEGRLLVDLEQHQEGRDFVYSGVWRSSDDGYWLWIGDEHECLDKRAESLAGGIAAGTVIPSCHEEEHPEEPAEEHEHGGDHGDDDGLLQPGQPAPSDVPSLVLADIELAFPRPVAEPHSTVAGGEVATQETVTQETVTTAGEQDGTFHLGVEHDGGSSGPGG